MTQILVGLVLFPLLLTVQMAIVSQLRLLQGHADLMLLGLLYWHLHEDLPGGRLWAVLAGALVGWASALPWPVALVAYSAFGLLTQALRNQLWSRSFLTAFVLIGLGTLLTQGMAWVGLRFIGRTITWPEALNLVILPSLLLNLLFALPVHALIDEIAAWVTPRRGGVIR